MPKVKKQRHIQAVKKDQANDIMDYTLTLKKYPELMKFSECYILNVLVPFYVKQGLYLGSA